MLRPRLALGLVLLGLAACSPPSGRPVRGDASATPVSSARVVVVTAVSTVELSAPATGGSTPTLVSPGVLTAADSGSLIRVHLGERVELHLDGEPDVTWTVSVDDPAVLRQLSTAGQEVFEAAAPGAAMLTAEGEPACRRAAVPCGLPNRVFQVRVEVSR